MGGVSVKKWRSTLFDESFDLSGVLDVFRPVDPHHVGDAHARLGWWLEAQENTITLLLLPLHSALFSKSLALFGSEFEWLRRRWRGLGWWRNVHRMFNQIRDPFCVQWQGVEITRSCVVL